jgi:hypothetical protein
LDIIFGKPRSQPLFGGGIYDCGFDRELLIGGHFSRNTLYIIRPSAGMIASDEANLWYLGRALPLDW